MTRRARQGVRGFVTGQRLLEWAAIVAGFVVVSVTARPSNWLGGLLLVLAGILVAAPVVLAACSSKTSETAMPQFTPAPTKPPGP